MAKGLRATTRKRNKTNLRATVFGPVHDARTARLSAKLQEIAAKPRPENDKAMDENVEQEKEREEREKSASSNAPEEMEVDAGNSRMRPTKTAYQNKSRASRIVKKIAKRKAKSSIVFAPNARQRKRLESKKRKN